jgi:alanine racemase
LKVLFAVKSDGYGHGIEAVSRTAEEAGIESLGVATVEEGADIRRAGVKLPVLLLGPVLPSEARIALDLDLTFQVSDVEFAQFLAYSAKKRGKKVRIQVNVDTGMGRFGVLSENAVLLLTQLRRLPALDIEGVFSHLAAADSELPEDQSYTLKQIEHFESLLAELDHANLLPPLRHIANSAGVIQYKDRVTSPRMNMIRIGTLFYGYLEVRRPWAEGVIPVATLTTRVIGLKELSLGDCVGYSRTYKASRHQRVAILSIGYGSGLAPPLSNRGQVWLNGKYAPVIGKICLDHTIVDVTDIDGVSIGDDVEVFGLHLLADRLAEMAGLPVCEVLVPALRGAADRVYQ